MVAHENILNEVHQIKQRKRQKICLTHMVGKEIGNIGSGKDKKYFDKCEFRKFKWEF